MRRSLPCPVLVVLAVLVLGACTGSAGSSETASSSGEPAVRGAADPGGGDAPRRDGVLELRVVAREGGHALSVGNGRATAATFAREILVERQVGDAWEAVDASQLLLRETCETETRAIFEPPACVSIAAGATLSAMPWTHSIGESQCMCEECGPAGSGTYRFVLTGCDAHTRDESPPFEVP